ncbi:MAG: NADH-quinone oxidoreductase subunit L, partial [Nitrospira sp.]|nr:NADH-quinone oxidoreductase subunit L [Nitrospira sp.]
MSFVILVLLLPLLAALIVVVGRPRSLDQRAKIGALPIIAAFFVAVVTLVLVSSQGPISLRFYEPRSPANLALPIGVYVDRLSAVMMTLITAVGTIIYLYSTGYMYQDRGYRRYLGLIAFT